MNSQRGQPSASIAAHTQPLLQPPQQNRHGSRAASGNSSNDVDHDDDHSGIFRSLRRRSVLSVLKSSAKYERTKVLDR